MSPVAGSQQLLSAQNTSALLKVLAHRGAVPRPELIEALGISKTAVGNILLQLTALGLVSRGADDHTPRGPAASVWQLTASYAYALSIDIGYRTISAALVDFCGSVLTREEVPRPSSAPEALQVLALMLRKVTGSVVPLATVVGMRTNAPGGFPSPDQIRQLLTAQFPPTTDAPITPQIIFTEPRFLAARHEAEFEPAKTAASFLLVRLGGRLDVAFVENGQVWEGNTGRAGDVELLDMQLNDGVALGAQSVKVDGKAAGLTQILDAKEIFTAAQNGDEAALLVARKTANRLAPLIRVLTHIYDPEVILLGGGIGAHPLLLELTQEALGADGAKLRGASSVKDPVLLGGATLATELNQEEIFSFAARQGRKTA